MRQSFKEAKMIQTVKFLKYRVAESRRHIINQEASVQIFDEDTKAILFRMK